MRYCREWKRLTDFGFSNQTTSGLKKWVEQGEVNIGNEMEKKLISVGIESSEKLIKVGAKDAFLRLKQKYPNVCLVHLYTLEGAIHDIEYNRLSEDTKKELKEFSDFLKT